MNANTTVSEQLAPDDEEITPSHRGCIMCGRSNPFSLGLHFHKVESAKVDDGNNGYAQRSSMVATRFHADASMQGYTGIIHGGVLSALLDTAMAHCLLHQGIEAVTGQLDVRYFSQVPCNSTLLITAWIDEALPPLYHLRAEIKVDDKRACKAKAKFMRRPDS